LTEKAQNAEHEPRHHYHTKPGQAIDNCRELETTVPSVSLGRLTLTLALPQEVGLSMGMTRFSICRGFFLWSLKCLVWESLSCRPASPSCLLAGRVCPACDLPPRVLVFTCTHARHRIELHLQLLTTRCSPLVLHVQNPSVLQVQIFVARRCYRCGTFSAQDRQQMADHHWMCASDSSPACFLPTLSNGTKIMSTIQ
jgi:hypothetical protein